MQWRLVCLLTCLLVASSYTPVALARVKAPSSQTETDINNTNLDLQENIVTNSEIGTVDNPLKLDMGSNIFDFPVCCNITYLKFDNTTYSYVDIHSQVISTTEYSFELVVYDKYGTYVTEYVDTWETVPEPKDILLDTIRAPFHFELMSNTNGLAGLNLTISNTTVEDGLFRSNAIPLNYDEQSILTLQNGDTRFYNISTVKDTWYFFTVQSVNVYYVEGYYSLKNASDYSFYSSDVFITKLQNYFKGDGSTFTLEYRTDAPLVLNVSLSYQIPVLGESPFYRFPLHSGLNQQHIAASSKTYLEFLGDITKYYNITLTVPEYLSSGEVNLEITAEDHEIVGSTHNFDSYPRFILISGYFRYEVLLENTILQELNITISITEFIPFDGYDLTHARVVSDGNYAFTPIDHDHPYVFNISTTIGNIYVFEFRMLDKINQPEITLRDESNNQLSADKYTLVSYDNKQMGWVLGSGADIIISIFPTTSRLQGCSMSLHTIDQTLYEQVHFIYAPTLETGMDFTYKVHRNWDGKYYSSSIEIFHDTGIIATHVINTHIDTLQTNLLYYDPSQDIYTVNILGSNQQPIAFSRYFILPSEIRIFPSNLTTSYASFGINSTQMFQYLFPGYSVSVSDNLVLVSMDYQAPDIEVYEGFTYDATNGVLSNYEYHIYEYTSGNSEEILIQLIGSSLVETTLTSGTQRKDTSPLYTVPFPASYWIATVLVIGNWVRKKQDYE